jgi:hypothetical protein
MQSSQIASIVVAVLTFIGCLVSPDPLVLLAAGGSLVAGLLLLWPRSGVPVMLMPFIVQWISVATKPIEAAVTGTALPDLAEFGGDLGKAAIFSSIALVCLAIGMRLGSLASGRDTLARLQDDVTGWSSRDMLTIGIGLVFAGHVFAAGASLISGLSEIMLALSNVTYCGLFMLVYWTLRTGRQGWVVGGVVVFEILLGMTGFFGVFRTALFTAALAVMCAQHRFKPRTLIVAAGVLVPALLLTVFWSGVKKDYREFANNGTKTQQVQQPLSARIDFLLGRAGTFDEEQFDDGFKTLLSRISYIDFLSLTLDYVPASTPHEYGDRTFAAVTHIFTPRLLFPDKPPLDSDTEVTSKYTGMAFTNYTYASISIGYLGEVYIDFGTYGAYVFMLVYGAILGFCVTLLLENRALPIVMSAGLTMMLVIPTLYFEQALIKTVGGTTATLIAVFLLQRFAFPALIRNFTDRAQRGTEPAHADQRPA